MSLEEIIVLSSPCSLCINGEPITLPEKEIVIQGFEFISNCKALADFAPILFQQQSDDCNLLQSIGTLCGCPKQDNACELCSDGAKAEYGWRELAFLAGSFGGIIPTCELVEAGLHSYNDTDSYCGGTQMVLGEYCGCGAELGSQPFVAELDSQICYLCFDGQPSPFPNKTIEIVGFPFETCGQLEQATETLFKNKFDGGLEAIVDNNCFAFRQLSVHCGCRPRYEYDGSTTCPICKVGNKNEVPYPEKLLDSSLTKFFVGAGMNISCGILADIATTWSGTSLDHTAVCTGLQGLGTHCGCSLPNQPACEVCSDALPIESFDLFFSDVAPYDLLSCGLLSSAALFVDDGARLPFGSNGDWIEFECQSFQYLGFLCGCNNGIFTYWGAETLEMQKAAVWVQRSTAMLSLIGSIAILVDIFTSKQRSTQGMYHQIMTGLSICDILSSIAWGLGPLPTNPDLAALTGIDQSLFREEVDTPFYGSHGNNTTCTAQGFLLHWGFTSMLYNVALSYFFKLSIVDGWRDSHFTPRYRALILGAPAIIGTGVALGAIPFITFTPVACTIGSYNGAGGWLKVIGLFYLPYGPAFIYTPLNTLYIYWKVRAQSRKGNRWRMPTMQPDSFSARIDETNNNTQDSSSDTIPATKRISKRIRRMLSLSHTESQMESLVFWQSCWYVAAFFASYSIFLVAFALDGWTMESYWFYMLLSILTPMQGFFNGFVYFRKRIAKSVMCGKKESGRPGTAPLQTLLNGLFWPMNALWNFVRPQRASSKRSSPDAIICVELRSSYFPNASSANLSQPIELLNARRANTTNIDCDQEEKVEEASLDEGLQASTANLSIIESESVEQKPIL